MFHTKNKKFDCSYNQTDCRMFNTLFIFSEILQNGKMTSQMYHQPSFKIELELASHHKHCLIKLGQPAFSVIATMYFWRIATPRRVYFTSLDALRHDAGLVFDWQQMDNLLVLRSRHLVGNFLVASHHI